MITSMINSMTIICTGGTLFAPVLHFLHWVLHLKLPFSQLIRIEKFFHVYIISALFDSPGSLLWGAGKYDGSKGGIHK